MKKKIKARLRSQAGETLAETLLALLVASLALVMLAGALSAAGSMIATSKRGMENYLAADAALAAHTNGTASTVTVGGADYSVTLYQNTVAEDIYAYGPASGLPGD